MTLNDEVEQLRAEVELLRTDKYRLDWLEKHAIDKTEHARPIEFYLWDWSLRDAIDEAMRQRALRLAEERELAALKAEKP